MKTREKTCIVGTIGGLYDVWSIFSEWGKGGWGVGKAKIESNNIHPFTTQGMDREERKERGEKRLFFFLIDRSG